MEGFIYLDCYYLYRGTNMEDEYKEYNGFRYAIKQDCDAESPCNWDNYGLIAFKRKVGFREGTKHRQDINLILPNDLYDLKMYKDENGEEYEEEVLTDPATYVERVYDAVIAIPLKFMDFGSSGSEVRECDADEANGVMYTTVKQILTLTGEDYDLSKIEDYMREELKQFNQWLEGDVWGYIIIDGDENDVDSCWGFFGYSECEKEAKSIIDHHIAYLAKLPVFEVVVTSRYRIPAKDGDAACEQIADRLAEDRYVVENSIEVSATEIIHGGD